MKNKNYNITIYDCLRDGTARFILGTSGNNTLITIGLNPSSANRVKSDYTVTKVIGFKDKAKKFDSFIMLNLYPQRATDPKDIHISVDKELYQENLKNIIRTLTTTKNASVLAAWGGGISKRDFFFQCLTDIYKATKSIKINWLQIGELTKKNHPQHPSRAHYNSELIPFNFNKYFLTLNPSVRVLKNLK